MRVTIQIDQGVQYTKVTLEAEEEELSGDDKVIATTTPTLRELAMQAVEKALSSFEGTEPEAPTVTVLDDLMGQAAAETVSARAVAIAFLKMPRTRRMKVLASLGVNSEDETQGLREIRDRNLLTKFTVRVHEESARH